MNDDDQYAQLGEFGDKVSAFVQGEIGQYLENARKHDENETIKKMILIDPWEYTELAQLQNAIARIQEDAVIARKVAGYLGDAIIRGREADDLLMSKED